MAAFSVTVPTGSAVFSGEEPGEWAGYPTNTLLTVLPNGGRLGTTEDKIELVMSGVDTTYLEAFLDGVLMPNLIRTANSVTVDYPYTTLGGPFRGTFTNEQPGGVKPTWASSVDGFIKRPYRESTRVAWLKNKEMISDTTVTYSGNATYTDDYVEFDGTEDTYLNMNTAIHGILDPGGGTDTSPHYLMMFEFRVPSTGVTINFGDSDASQTTYHGWLLRVYTSRFDIMHGDGGSPSSSNRISVQYPFSAITDWSYTPNTWHKVVLYVTALNSGKVSVNGGAVFNSSGTSGSGSSMNAGSTSAGKLGAYTSDVDPDVEGTFDLRMFAIIKGEFSDAELTYLSEKPYSIFQETNTQDQGASPQPAWSTVRFLFQAEGGALVNKKDTTKVWEGVNVDYDDGNGGGPAPNFLKYYYKCNTAGTTTADATFETNPYQWSGRFVTFEVWAYWDSTYPATADGFRRINSWANTGGIENYGFGVDFAAQKQRTFVWTGSSALVISSWLIPKDQWNHMVYAYDPNSNTFYHGLNGVMEATAFNPSWSVSSATHRILGSNGNGAWPGYIEEMRWTEGLVYGTGTSYTVPTVPFPANY